MAGAAKVEITPVKGTLIGGDFVSFYARLFTIHYMQKVLS